MVPAVFINFAGPPFQSRTDGPVSAALPQPQPDVESSLRQFRLRTLALIAGTLGLTLAATCLLLIVNARDDGMGTIAAFAAIAVAGLAAGAAGGLWLVQATTRALRGQMAVCRMMGGLITAASEPAIGSAFTVSLPVDAPDTDADGPETAAGGAARATRAVAQGIEREGCGR